MYLYQLYTYSKCYTVYLSQIGFICMQFWVQHHLLTLGASQTSVINLKKNESMMKQQSGAKKKNESTHPYPHGKWYSTAQSHEHTTPRARNPHEAFVDPTKKNKKISSQDILAASWMSKIGSQDVSSHCSQIGFNTIEFSSLIIPRNLQQDPLKGPLKLF